jgi:hypothetical protein
MFSKKTYLEELLRTMQQKDFGLIPARGNVLRMLSTICSMERTAILRITNRKLCFIELSDLCRNPPLNITLMLEQTYLFHVTMGHVWPSGKEFKQA